MQSALLLPRRHIDWRLKLNPLWLLFGNADDGTAPESFEPSRSMWQRRLLWWLRNPAHNLTFYGIGVADRERVLWSDFGTEVHNPNGGWLLSVTYVGPLPLPFVSYIGHRIKAYVGWRPAGAFGVKFNLVGN